MAENFGTGVSYVYDNNAYSYDTIIFQKQYPPLDTELNAVQQLQNIINKRSLYHLPSGWLNFKPFYTSSSLTNEFYTQDPTGAIPEYALVNGYVIQVTNTATSEINTNKIVLSDPPITGSKVSAVFLEVWRALLAPNSNTNKPPADTVIDPLNSISVYNSNVAWTAGNNGIVLYTDTGGIRWTEQLINTKYDLNSIFFIDDRIGWVVGDGGTLARTSNAGSTWIMIQSGVTDNLNAIHAISSIVGWAVGDSGVILKTANGITWVPQTSSITANLRSVYFLDANSGWAVGDSGTIIKTGDGGVTWTAQASGVTANLNSVFFYNAVWGIAVGDSGTIVRTCNGGSTWTTTGSFTTDLKKVLLIPDLDEYVNGEEVSSQFNGTNKNFTTVFPISKGDGYGVATIVPGDVQVTVKRPGDVDATYVAVDSVDGINGGVVLNLAPAAGSIVKVYYYHPLDSSVFKGYTWVVGEVSGGYGVVYRSTDWTTWTAELPGSGYDVLSVGFANKSSGWVVGDKLKIYHTNNGTDATVTWTEQLTNVLSRQVERIYKEGNTGAISGFLTDDMVHPDTNIETTKRVQVQYRIRVIDNVDPYNYPESGLGSDLIVSLGPNTTGAYNYTNMGTETGDYGLWRARCINTVDGYSWAVPMFFVTRRNSSSYDPSENANGSSTGTGVNLRLDGLTATQIVSNDILDVRRKVIIPSTTELLDKNFDALMKNQMKNRLHRSSVGGDHYGTELMQVDRIGGASTDGGTEISGATLSGAIAGDVKSSVVVATYSVSNTDIVTRPSNQVINAPAYSVFHPNSNHYRAIYESTSSWNGKTVPGYWQGIGTTQATFFFSESANTISEDVGLVRYLFMLDYVSYGSSSLTLVPSGPLMVKNIKSGQNPYYFQGVEEGTAGKIIESWSSGITGYDNYAIVYPYSNLVSKMSSPVELHYFYRITSLNLGGFSSNNTLEIPVAGFFYNVFTVSKILNKTSSFSYKIEDQSIDNSYLTVTSSAGYEFVENILIEITAAVKYEENTVRNGGSVNFILGDKSIRSFCKSENLTTAIIASLSANISSTDGYIVGVSSTETIEALQKYICWVDGVMTPVEITGLGTANITLTFTTPQTGTIEIQVLTLMLSFDYQDPGDGLLIGYDYIPYQSIPDLPTTLIVDPVIQENTVYVSSLGNGSSIVAKEPYDNPLMHIPINDVNITDDKIYNIEPLRFSSFSIDSGFVQMPVYIPADIGSTLTLSASTKDYINRYFYSECLTEFKFVTDNLKIGEPRKIFIPILVRVKESSDDRLLKGEYLLMIVSRTAYLETDNYTGYEADGVSVMAMYRLPNKPIVRV